MWIGFAVEDLEFPVTYYIDTLGTRTAWITSGIGWDTFLTWIRDRNSRNKVVVVTSMEFIPFLDYTKHQTGAHFVCLEIDKPSYWLEADANYNTVDLGWGVDKMHWWRIGERREWQREPSFFLTGENSSLEDGITNRGYKVFKGDAGYVAANVAIVPEPRVVPHDIYNAMATGMPVVTTRDNAPWLSSFPSFDVFVEDGVEAIIEEVRGTDFKNLGMMAQEMVPDTASFRESLIDKLTF